MGTTVIKQSDTYRLYTEGDKTMIERLKYPRWVGELTFGQLSDIEHIELKDQCKDVMEMARSLRMAGEFVVKYKKP
ncbi:MAG: hypothetical protein WCJ03_03120 [Bacteroidales bacterium]